MRIRRNLFYIDITLADRNKRASPAFSRKPLRQPELLPVRLAGHEHRTLGYLRLEQRLLVSPSHERQRHLAAFGGGTLQRKHDLGAHARAIEVARVYLRV